MTQKTNLEKLKEDNNPIDNCVLKKTCEAILKDIEGEEYLITDDRHSEGFRGGFTSCYNIITELIKKDKK